MFVYGKMAANAIAIMSYLAALPERWAGSTEIAKARRIPATLTAKILTQLATAGLVKGQPGPGGGYALNKPAAEICLADIAALFEQTSIPTLCPFGEGWCGTGEPCPLHNRIDHLLKQSRKFIEETRLSIFAKTRKDVRALLTGA